MANWTELKIDTLLNDHGIIRNRLKILAARQNARSYLDLIEEKGSFSDFLWSFVNQRQITNYWKTWDETPPKTKEFKYPHLPSKASFGPLKPSNAKTAHFNPFWAACPT